MAATVSAYDRATALGPQELEALLAAGAERTLLEDLFGAAACGELVPLARAARASRRRRPHDRPRAWVLPGILGTRLGLPRSGGLPADAIWLDPDDLLAGRAQRLRRTARDRVRPLGVIDQGYLKLWLRLAAEGFDPEYFAYDWRRGVAELGAAFATRLRSDARPAAIVAHSLGGLVARAALRRAKLPPVTRVLLLGTPNRGSYAAVQAMRGSYAVVRRIAMLDRHHDGDALTHDVFSSFESLHDLLPEGPIAASIDFHEPASWPESGPRPDAARLAVSRGLAARLAPADARHACIAGHGFPTAVAARRGGGQFIYTYRHDGDGTVPLDSAALPGVDLYLAPVAHGLLPRDDRVLDAVIDLLRTGSTGALRAGPPRKSTRALQVGDHALRAALDGKLDWGSLDAARQRAFLENLSDPGPLRAATPRRRR